MAERPMEYLRQLREERGEAYMQNRAPLALAVRLVDGFDVDDPTLAFKRAVTVSPAVDPVLEAVLEASGATRRGRATWSIGHGEDSPVGVISSLMRYVGPESIFLEEELKTRRGVSWKQPDIRQRRSYQMRRLIGLKTGPVREALYSDRFDDVFPANLAREEALRTAPAMAYGAIVISTAMHATFVQFRSLEPDDDGWTVPARDSGLTFNLWPLGKNRRDPQVVYGAQAAQFAQEAAARGIEVLEGAEFAALPKIRDAVRSSVVAWPRPGRPAQSVVAVGARVPERVRKQLTDVEPDGRDVAVFCESSSEALTEVLGNADDVRQLVHPAVRDVVRMRAAVPVDDESLRDYQREAVALHLSTEFGYVNASSPGLGKTIMLLAAMALRARKVSPYRGLVVAEANVRSQWAKEASQWFPAATVVMVESSKDAAVLEQTLADAGPFPVLVVTSYTLVSDVQRVLKASAAEAEAAAEAADDTEVPDESDAAAPEVTEPAPTPSEVEELIEPADLLGWLEVILQAEPAAAAVSSEAADVEDEAPRPSRLGEVLMGIHWNDLVADEAVTLRNVGSSQSRALWHLRQQSDVAVALTGTPINKSVDDLGNLISWVRGDRSLFHGVRLEKAFDLSDDEQLEDFTQAIGPVLFRRDKSEIVDELPEMTTQVVELEPTPAEKALANGARTELKRAYDDLMAWMDAAESEHEGTPEYEVAKEALRAARHAWLGGTTLARMASSDPAALLTARGAGAALLASQGLIEAATSQSGTKRRWVVPETVKRVGRGQSILIFTEFATVARGIIADLADAGVRVGAVMGGGGKARDRATTQFTAGELDVLVCTSAGKRGLNLQTATTVVHYDLPWTPEDIIQRSGRVERIGATSKRVEVLFPIMRGTIEERVSSVVVARAAKMLRALDVARGVDASKSDVGRAIGSLATTARDDEVKPGEAALLTITREILGM